jgi:hypothetical protein
MTRSKHYTPALNRFLVSVLYHQSQVQKVPMTKLANQIVTEALANSEGWKRAEAALKENPPAYSVQ